MTGDAAAAGGAVAVAASAAAPPAVAPPMLGGGKVAVPMGSPATRLASLTDACHRPWAQ